MNDRSAPTHPISTFIRTSEDTMVAEMSDFGKFLSRPSYDMGCRPECFFIEGKKHTIKFRFHGKKFHDGDLQFIEFIPCFDQPHQPIKKIVIFND